MSRIPYTANRKLSPNEDYQPWRSAPSLHRIRFSFDDLLLSTVDSHNWQSNALILWKINNAIFAPTVLGSAIRHWFVARFDIQQVGPKPCGAKTHVQVSVSDNIYAYWVQKSAIALDCTSCQYLVWVLCDDQCTFKYQRAVKEWSILVSLEVDNGTWIVLWCGPE